MLASHENVLQKCVEQFLDPYSPYGVSHVLEWSGFKQNQPTFDIWTSQNIAPQNDQPTKHSPVEHQSGCSIFMVISIMFEFKDSSDMTSLFDLLVKEINANNPIRV